MKKERIPNPNPDLQYTFVPYRRDYEWKPSRERLYGHLCVELVHPGSSTIKEEKEYCLASNLGVITKYSDTRARVVWRTAKIAQKLVKKYKNQAFYSITEGSEGVCTVPDWIVPELIKDLKIKKNRKTQAIEANSF